MTRHYYLDSLEKPATLEVFKYEPKKHSTDFARLALYFNKLWQWSMPQKGKTQSIPLMRLYRTLSSKRYRPLVKMVASIWFTQVGRGSNLTGKVSAWERRKHPKYNKQVMNALMTAENALVTEEMWTIAQQKNEVEVCIKTVVKFPTIEAATQFQEAVMALLNEAQAEPDQEVLDIVDKLNPIRRTASMFEN